MAEALLRMDHVVAASEEVAKAALQLKGVENTFLHSRRARLERSIEHSGTFVSRFEGGSTLVAERDKLGRAYLLHLARRNGVEVQDLLGQYSRLKSPGITRTQLRTLLDRYGRRGERPVPPPHLDD